MFEIKTGWDNLSSPPHWKALYFRCIKLIYKIIDLFNSVIDLFHLMKYNHWFVHWVILEGVDNIINFKTEAIVAGRKVILDKWVNFMWFKINSIENGLFSLFNIGIKLLLNKICNFSDIKIVGIFNIWILHHNNIYISRSKMKREIRKIAKRNESLLSL